MRLPFELLGDSFHHAAAARRIRRGGGVSGEVLGNEAHREFAIRDGDARVLLVGRGRHCAWRPRHSSPHGYRPGKPRTSARNSRCEQSNVLEARHSSHELITFNVECGRRARRLATGNATCRWLARTSGTRRTQNSRENIRGLSADLGCGGAQPTVLGVSERGGVTFTVDSARN